jgi:hypothetical protein
MTKHKPYIVTNRFNTVIKACVTRSGAERLAARLNETQAGHRVSVNAFSSILTGSTKP